MAFTLVSGQATATLTDNSTSGTVAAPGNVTAGNFVCIGASLYSTGARTFTAADCVKASGTATIGTVVLGSTADRTGADGHYIASVFLVPITGSGSLTMRVSGAAGSYWTVALAEFHSDVGTSFAKEAGVAGTATGSANVASGNMTSAGAAVFFGIDGFGNCGGSPSNVVDAAFTSIFNNFACTGSNAGGAAYRIVSTGTTDTIEWAPGNIGNWGADAAAAGMVIKDAGGSPYSLAAAQGSYTESGQAAILREAHKVIATQGSYTESGQIAGLQYGRKVGATQGAYAESGQAANFKRNYAVAALQGSYVESGQVASFPRTYKGVSDQGDYVLDGQDADFIAPTVTQEATFVGYAAVEDDAGTIVWPDGTAAGDSAVIMLWGNDTLALSGSGWTQDINTALVNDQGSHYSAWHKASLSSGDISSPPTFSGASFGGYQVYTATNASGVNFLGNTGGTVTFGTLTIPAISESGTSSLLMSMLVDRTSTTVTIVQPSGWTDRGQDQQGFFTADAADIASSVFDDANDIVWTGLDVATGAGGAVWEFTATAGGNLMLSGSRGTFVLAGQIVDLDFDHIIAGTQGAYTESGQAAGLLLVRKVAGTQGSFSETGQSATLIVLRTLSMGQGSYALNGQSVNLIHLSNVSASFGSYSTTGEDSGLRKIVFIHPDADISDGGWTNEADSNVNLFASIDETGSANETDFIKSGDDPAADIVRLRLPAPPGAVAEPMRVRYDYKKEGTGTIDITVRLFQGATLIAEWIHNNVSDSYIVATQTLGHLQFANISDFSNLIIEIQADLV